VNKNGLLALLEGRLGSRDAAADALEAVLDEIQRAVAAGARVTLTGFGTFERVERPARTGRNPRTGAAIEIAASAAPRFHAGATLRAAVAGATPAPRDQASAPRARRATAAVPTAPAEPAKKPKKVKKDKSAKKPKSPGKTAKSGKKK